MHLIPLFRLWKWQKTIPALTKEQLEQESNLGLSAYKRAVCNSTLLQYNTCQIITGQLGRSVAHQGRYDIPKSREGEVDLCSLLEALTLGKRKNADTRISTSTLSLYLTLVPGSLLLQGPRLLCIRTCLHRRLLVYTSSKARLISVQGLNPVSKALMYGTVHTLVIALHEPHRLLGHIQCA